TLPHGSRSCNRSLDRLSWKLVWSSPPVLSGVSQSSSLSHQTRRKAPGGTRIPGGNLQVLLLGRPSSGRPHESARLQQSSTCSSPVRFQSSTQSPYSPPRSLMTVQLSAQTSLITNGDSGEVSAAARQDDATFDAPGVGVFVMENSALPSGMRARVLPTFSSWNSTTSRTVLPSR